MSVKSNDEARQSIPNALAKLMDEHGTCARDLAEFLDVSPSAVTNYRKGRRKVDIETLCRICDFYSIGVAEMIGGGKEAPLLNEEEKVLIENYRGLSDTDRSMVRRMVGLLSSEENPKKR